MKGEKIRMNEEISFGDELDQEIEEQIQDSYRPDGKILGPMRYVPLKLPKERIERMMNSYGTVWLQDFSDIYHLTDEQRSERDEFYQVETKMRKCQAKYRKIPQFINAWRITIEALKAVAKLTVKLLNHLSLLLRFLWKKANY